MSGAYLALTGLMGLGIGAIIRHSAAAVATLAGGLFVLPIVIGTAAGHSSASSRPS
jgi:ABC-2 type transport system permease protein